MPKKEKAPKQDGSFSKSVIVAVLVSVVIYTIAAMIVFVVTGGIEMSTLTISFFGFCGGEVGILGWIRTAKEKNDAKIEAEKLKNNATKSGDEQEIE